MALFHKILLWGVSTTRSIEVGHVATKKKCIGTPMFCPLGCRYNQLFVRTLGNTSFTALAAEGYQPVPINSNSEILIFWLPEFLQVRASQLVFVNHSLLIWHFSKKLQIWGRQLSIQVGQVTANKKSMGTPLFPATICLADCPPALPVVVVWQELAGSQCDDEGRALIHSLPLPPAAVISLFLRLRAS